MSEQARDLWDTGGPFRWAYCDNCDRYKQVKKILYGARFMEVCSFDCAVAEAEAQSSSEVS